MNKRTKTTLQLIIAAFLFASFAVTGCNNSSESGETKAPDSTATQKTMEVAPAAGDTTHTGGDTASTRPTPTGNQ